MDPAADTCVAPDEDGVLELVEHRLDLVFEGVADGRISLNRWVQVCATDPARISGLYPKKGTIAPGSDADIVIYDPGARHTLSAATHHMNIDFSVFEGIELDGAVDTVFLRGEAILEGGASLGERGAGRYVPRGPNSLMPVLDV